MSELHQRLSHLVNYSSQLIFVSGETVAEQQRTLNKFLAEQTENTEVSYFNAQSFDDNSECRKAICRQLGGHTVGSFVRPLNTLLHDLNASNGPYLVCITQADLLSEEFLKELWDWVNALQTQSSGETNKVHLNVILFGGTDWANHTLEWLPSLESHKPILLSSQSVDPVGFDVNALEALMADGNSWFSQSNKPLITQKWFITSVLLGFLIVFVALISWQYPQQVSNLFKSSTEHTETSTDGIPFNVEELNAITEKRSIVSDKDINAKLSSDTSNDDTANMPLPLERISKDKEEPQSSAPATPKNALGSKNSSNDDTPGDSSEASVTDELLVKKWGDEGSAEQVAIGSGPLNEKVDSRENEKLVKSDNSVGRETQTDFQVPDIISVEQLDEKLGESLAKELEMSNDGRATSETAQNSSINEPPADYQYDETTLLALPENAVLLQLAGIQNRDVLNQFLQSNDLQSRTWVYETQRYGGAWYVVLLNTSFSNIDAAIEAIKQLPKEIQEAQPFAKSIQQIKQEIAQASPT